MREMRYAEDIRHVDFLGLAPAFAKITFSIFAQILGRPELGVLDLLAIFLKLLNSLPTVVCVIVCDYRLGCL